jgi:hypothetical protein
MPPNIQTTLSDASGSAASNDSTIRSEGAAAGSPGGGGDSDSSTTTTNSNTNMRSEPFPLQANPTRRKRQESLRHPKQVTTENCLRVSKAPYNTAKMMLEFDSCWRGIDGSSGTGIPFETLSSCSWLASSCFARLLY